MAACKIKRRMLITHGIMYLDGRPSKETKKEWVEQECGTPIFGKSGEVCSSCLKGWNTEHNFMLDTPENNALIENAKTNK